MRKLNCRGLVKRFGGVKALDNVTLDFPSSGIVAIIGPNGAGKTTLINTLTGFLPLDLGDWFLDGRRLTLLQPFRIAQLGIVRSFQELRLILDMSVLENVLLARPKQRGEKLIHAILGFGVAGQEGENRSKAGKLLQLVGLGEKSRFLVRDLSYGEQKLLGIACSLATDAGILLLDEPVAGVHPATAGKILDLMRELRGESRLVVFIEHDIGAVRRVADQVVVMDEGRVIAQGVPTDVLERPEIMEAYLA